MLRLPERLLPFLLLFVFFGAPAQAQQMDAETLADFQRAERFVSQGAFEDALPLLAQLTRREPATYAFYKAYRDALVEAKRYEEALAAVDAFIEATEATPIHLAEKGRIAFMSGEADQARQFWSDAIALQPEHPNSYAVVYRSMADRRLFGEAAEMLLEGRRALADSSLFRSEVAYLQLVQAEHERAAREYVALLHDQPERANLIRRRLMRFVADSSAWVPYVAEAERAVRGAPLDATLRDFLGWLQVRSGAFDAAEATYRALDQLEQTNGAAMLRFAREAEEAKATDAARRAYAFVAGRHEGTPAAAEAAFRQIMLLDAEQASRRAQLRDFIERYPWHERVPAALASIAQSALDDRAWKEAESAIDQLLAEHPASTAAREAALLPGQLELRRGDLDAARLAFRHVSEAHPNTEVADAAWFEEARTLFLAHSFETAASQLDVIASRSETDVANDALRLKLLIRDGRGLDSSYAALEALAEARLARLTGQSDRALTALDSAITLYGAHKLIDELRYERAETLAGAGDMRGAERAYGSFVATHPSSPRADEALYERGRLLEELGEIDAARAAYDQLLTEYGSSVLVDETRARLRALPRSRT